MQDLLNQITPEMLEAAKAAANTQREEKVKAVPKEPQRRVRITKPKEEPVTKTRATEKKAGNKKLQPLKGTKEITPNTVYYRYSSPWTRGMNRYVYIAAAISTIGCFTSHRKGFMREEFTRFYRNCKVLSDCLEGNIMELTADNKKVRLSSDGWHFLNSQIEGSAKLKAQVALVKEQFLKGGDHCVKV